MSNTSKKAKALLAAVLTLAFLMIMTPTSLVRAADHGDAPMADEDRPADIDDVYAFLDPNDNSKLIIVITLYGFIVPGEAVNFSAFDPRVRYLVGLETTGDARIDQFIDIRFSPRTATTIPQTATVTMPFGEIINAPTTVPTLADTPNPPTITTDPGTGISVFAGETDDPFFFDIPGFNRFVASVLGGSPNPAALQRGRDSFAGYNVQAIALSIPVSYFRLQRTPDNPSGTVIGVNIQTQRQRKTTISRTGEIQTSGGFVTIDRMGNPAINVALIPFARKDEYNQATTLDDANGRFAADIVSTLRALGTNDTNIGILANVAVAKGDFLHLDTSVPNSGPGGGDNAGAGFPNGRRLKDDTIDTILFFIANQNPLGDNVNANDVPLRNSFPFLAPPQQPRASGTDDNTRN
ncbi:MAG TPA: DUF4331 family protein [Blastocatellia bacterium]|nr:DUF4331 family protein [Blastocatellia bacterium]